MYGSRCNGTMDTPNGSKAVTLLLRLSTMALALTSAVVMATASECTIYGLHGAKATVTFKDYPPLVYLVGFNITAGILEAVAVYLQLGKGDDEEEGPKLPRILLVVFDVAVQSLLSLSTGAVFAAVVAYGPQISACAGAAGRFCEQVHRSKLLSFAAGTSAGLAAVAKDVPLPFSVWPASSD
ncbi:CASP-like protein 1U2 [Phragmites australis]|uniref:CASP-like protein 1U2 n=1 Tax=Phragmites australis TaxID=29695 RepID=UPI002D7758B0|nr:CASP-like protein 1U2 [Phragmites australis]